MIHFVDVIGIGIPIGTPNKKADKITTRDRGNIFA
jgi:hypothetical protein